jgi:hypothetical protein
MENIKSAKHPVYAPLVMKLNVFGLITPATAAKMVQIGNRLAKISVNFLKFDGTTPPSAARATARRRPPVTVVFANRPPRRWTLGPLAASSTDRDDVESLVARAHPSRAIARVIPAAPRALFARVPFAARVVPPRAPFARDDDTTAADADKRWTTDAMVYPRLLLERTRRKTIEVGRRGRDSTRRSFVRSQLALSRDAHPFIIHPSIHPSIHPRRINHHPSSVR